MIFKPTKLLIAAMTLAAGVALALPASAQSTKPVKPKRQASPATTAQQQANYRGQEKFRAGPLFNGSDYLGDDPDPFIRLQIQRDLTARYPGND